MLKILIYSLYLVEIQNDESWNDSIDSRKMALGASTLILVTFDEILALMDLEENIPILCFKREVSGTKTRRQTAW